LKILLLSQHYFPEPDLMHTLCTGLVQREHFVKVLTGYPNYPYGKIYRGYKQRLLARQFSWECRAQQMATLYKDILSV